VKILFTGATSFTGVWFVEALHAAGFDVTVALTRTPDAYSGVRAMRVAKLAALAKIVPNARFGDETFLDLVQSQDFDALCHHAAVATDYRSLDFDLVGALAQNTNGLRAVLTSMIRRRLKAVVFTGSVFEQNEGGGDNPRRAFSPYGLSKGLTWQVLRYWCTLMGIPLGKFIIANPFGPLEEPRFVNYLAKTWHSGAIAEVRTPTYVRDNIHIDLLALMYARFTQQTVEAKRDDYCGPCGYVETQGAFAQRVAEEFRKRSDLECGLNLLAQTDFSEPLMRTNTDVIKPADFGWSENAAWDSLVEFYRRG
jgi:UDP-glucose 4-epimerase